MTSKIVQLIALSICGVSLFGDAQTFDTTQSNRKIHVVIVAVPKFAIQDYNGSAIESAFTDRCDELQKFFVNHLGKDNVAVHPYCTADATTREALRHLFSIDLPGFSAKTVTLVFIMSHGESVEFDNGYLASDLELITSDTRTSDEENDAKGERQFSSILVGSELLPWLQRAPAGSTILMFVDTCHSGAAASVSANFAAALAKQFGLGSLVLASSLGRNDTYGAIFTKELMELWEGAGGCLNRDSLPNDIYQKMKGDAPLKTGEGTPKYVLNYSGPLCLGNFGKDHKLLFLYAGQDADSNPFRYDIAEDSLPAKTIISDQLLQQVYVPIPLDSKKYVVKIRRGTASWKPINIDLTSSQSETVWLDEFTQSKTVPAFYETEANVAELNGSPEWESARLRQAALMGYRILGTSADATRVVEELVSKNETIWLDALDQTSAALSGSHAVIGPTFHRNPTSTGSLAPEVGVAAAALEQSAEGTQDIESRKMLAKYAYYARSSLGDVAGAKKIRQKFDLSLGRGYMDLEASASRDANGADADRFKALGLAGVLGAHVASQGN